MPPRYAYWTILIDKGPTAFRARDRDELLPTLTQLRRTNTDVELKWFARGRLWDSPEQEQFAAQMPRVKRPQDWRPGGTHKDPRQRFKPHGPRRDDRPEGGTRFDDRSKSAPRRDNRPQGAPRFDDRSKSAPRRDDRPATASRPDDRRKSGPPRQDRPTGGSWRPDRPWNGPRRDGPPKTGRGPRR